MIAYASRTGTRRNLDAMRAANEEAGADVWRLMVSARGVLRHEGFRYALDNGAWTAFQNGEAFDVAAFERALRLLGPGADFIVLPDIVMGGLASLALTRLWLKRLRHRKALRGVTLLVAVQNGMEPRHVRRLLGPKVGVFVGGDTDWKEATMAMWAELAHSRGAYCHVGRVNTVRRVRLCNIAGVDSWDGSSVSRFAVTLGPLEAERQQPDMLAHCLRPPALSEQGRDAA